MPGSVDVDVLARSVVLGTLPRGELEQLLPSFRRRNYRRGETIMHQGDPGNVVHVVCEGRLKVVLPSEAGDEAVLTILGPGDVLGEMALLDGEPRSATAVALEPVITATLSRESFMELLRRSPAAVEGVLAGLAQTIRRLSSEVGDLMFLDLQGRLAKKLLELAESHGQDGQEGIEIQATLTQEDLAGMIGATRPRVNQLLGSFEDRGAISRRGRRIVIRRADALSRWASG
jgi:CRP/FNR family transcriptional regulator/CRP/FNR family cyclic AMP-dependent transcriptional regulator